MGLMNRALLCAVLLTASSCAHAGIRLSDAEAEAVGRKDRGRTSNATIDGLTHWNKGEDFASLGIGHFIWYKAGERGPFTESFPGLLDALAASRADLARLAPGQPPCPWSDRDAFFADFRGPRLNELRAILTDTIGVQARYAADRLRVGLAQNTRRRPGLGAPGAPGPLRPRRLRAQRRVRADGLRELQGRGHQYRRALQRRRLGPAPGPQGMMDSASGQPSVKAFAESADAALAARGQQPAARDENRWLPGWRKRLLTYLDN